MSGLEGNMKNDLAQGMWDKMVSALEVEVGLLESYKDDVYKHDRRTVGAIWAEDSKYLWVVRENGSHLSRVGIGDKKTEVEVVLTSICGGRSDQKCGIWLIEVGAAGVARVKKLARKAALDWCRWRQFTTLNGEVRRSQKIVANVEVEQVRDGPGLWGFTMAIRTHGGSCSRGDVLAAYSEGLELARQKVGMFGKLKGCTLNGGSLDAVAPVYEIELKAEEVA
jgi:hypothetical protein